MIFFNFKPTRKHIEIFEQNVAEFLKNDFPKIKEALALSSDFHSIQFPKKPSGIYISRGQQERIPLEYKINFDLYGLKVFNKKNKQYEEIILFYNQHLLTLIETKNPRNFHKTYDLYKFQIGDLKTKEINFENPDRKITLKILKEVSKDKLKQLEIENTFEIEINQNLYYTILNMKNGNYIAVDKSGKVYRLNHQQIEKVKKISNTVDDFFDLYQGNKSNLVHIMNQ
ncbi:hypothetical protein [Flavobacterium eburneipallidum]|uniref:hypothetical protein n=1 Tax=Flavobacterium eburneipallidum TaxID=3003263 RepID=UPI0022AC121D|nr:hypothetical protein [Flavobacterium eburneipallidum]